MPYLEPYLRHFEIIALQELGPLPQEHLGDLRRRHPPFLLYENRGQGCHGALLAFSQRMLPFVTVRPHLQNDRTAMADVSVPGLPTFTVGSIYGSCLASEQGPLQTQLQPLLSAPILWMGDLNFTCQPTLDSSGIAYPPTWPWLQLLIARGQLVDAWRHLHPLAPGFTRSTDRGQNRLDYCLLSPDLALNLGSARLEPCLGSDHAGLSLDMNLAVPTTFRIAPRLGPPRQAMTSLQLDGFRKALTVTQQRGHLSLLAGVLAAYTATVNYVPHVRKPSASERHLDILLTLLPSSPGTILPAIQQVQADIRHTDSGSASGPLQLPSRAVRLPDHGRPWVKLPSHRKLGFGTTRTGCSCHGPRQANSSQEPSSILGAHRAATQCNRGC